MDLVIDAQNEGKPSRELWPWSCAFCVHYSREKVCWHYIRHDCKGSRDWLHNVAQAPVAQRHAVPPKFVEKET